MSLKTNTLKNSAFNIGAFLWPLLLTFFVTPYIVRVLGEQQYGILALVTSFIGFFAVLDLGVAPSLVKYISEYAAQNKLKKLNKIFSASLIFYLIIGSVGAVLIVVGSHIFLDIMLKNSTLDRGLVQAAFWIASVGFLVNMLLSAYSAVPGALQRLDITSTTTIIVSTISSLGTALLVAFGFQIVALVTFNVLTSLIGVVAYYIIDRHLVPSLRFTGAVHREDFLHIFRFSGYAFIATISGMVISQFDRLLLGAQLGPSAVTFYVIPGNLTIKILGLINAAANVMFPLTAALIATNQYEKLQAVYRRASRVIVLILVFIVPAGIVMSNKFLLYWLGPEFAEKSTLVLQILLVTYGISSLHALPFLSSFGAGKPKYNAYYSLLVAILNVAFMFILIPKFGIYGASIAYLIAVLPTLFFIPYVEKRVLKLDASRFWLDNLRRIIILLLIILPITFIANYFISSLWMVVVAYILTLIVSGIIGLYAKVFDSEDITLILQSFTKLRNRVSK